MREKTAYDPRLIELSPAEEKKIKEKQNLLIDRNYNIVSALWNVWGTAFLLLAALVAIVGSHFVHFESISAIASGIISRQVGDSGGSREFWSVFVFTISGVLVLVASFCVLLSAIFGVRGILFEPNKKVWGILAAITSIGMGILVCIPLIEFGVTYILNVFG